MKTKVVKQNAIDDPEIQDMFNQMLGNGTPNAEVIAPKYESIMDNTRKIIGAFRSIFVDTKYIPAEINSEFCKALEQVKIFCDSGEVILSEFALNKEKTLTQEQLNAANSDPVMLEKMIRELCIGYDPVQLQKKYFALKESALINRIIVSVRDLTKIVMDSKVDLKKSIHDLEQKNKLCDDFIKWFDGDFLQLIPSITNLDFKQVWLHELCDDVVKKRFVYGMYLFLEKGNIIVNNVTSPDIDIERFSELLIKCIDGLRKNIPRCDKAFNKIKSSISLLKNNFGEYYKDFVVSQNPGIIIENFVSDVAGSSNVDMETTRQFRTIIEFYKKHSQNMPKDKNTEKILDMLNKNMDALEQEQEQAEAAQKKPKKRNAEDMS